MKQKADPFIFDDKNRAKIVVAAHHKPVIKPKSISSSLKNGGGPASGGANSALKNYATPNPPISNKTAAASAEQKENGTSTATGTGAAGSILPVIGRSPQIINDTKQSLMEIFTSVNSIH